MLSCQQHSSSKAFCSSWTLSFFLFFKFTYTLPADQTIYDRIPLKMRNVGNMLWISIAFCAELLKWPWSWLLIDCYVDCNTRTET